MCSSSQKTFLFLVTGKHIKNNQYTLKHFLKNTQMSRNIILNIILNMNAVQMNTLLQCRGIIVSIAVCTVLDLSPLLLFSSLVFIHVQTIRLRITIPTIIRKYNTSSNINVGPPHKMLNKMLNNNNYKSLY